MSKLKSLEVVEEFNRILIDAKKNIDILYKSVGEFDRIKGDFEHDVINDYHKLSAKEKRKKFDELFNILVERHEVKYRYRELEILKELNDVKDIQKVIDSVINKLRKLNQEMETPIYYKRAEKNKGEVVIVQIKDVKDEDKKESL